MTELVSASSSAEASNQGFAPTVDSSRLIFVVPVDGVPGPASLVLADAVAASLRDAKKPAIIAENINELGPTIAGRIVEVIERGTVAWVTIVWELRAPYGTAVAEYRQQVVVDSMLWKSGSAEAINVLVFDAGPRIVSMVDDFVSPMAEIIPPAPAMIAQAPAQAQAPAPMPAAAPPSPMPAPALAPAAEAIPEMKKARKNSSLVAAVSQKSAPPVKKKPRMVIGKPLMLKKNAAHVAGQGQGGSKENAEKGQGRP